MRHSTITSSSNELFSYSVIRNILKNPYTYYSIMNSTPEKLSSKLVNYTKILRNSYENLIIQLIN